MTFLHLYTNINDYICVKFGSLQVSVCVMPTLTSLAVALYIVKVVSTHRKKLAEGLLHYYLKIVKILAVLANLQRKHNITSLSAAASAKSEAPVIIFRLDSIITTTKI